MSYRPLVIAAAVTALSVMHITNVAAQSVYVAPGGVYIGAGAGPVFVGPSVPTNGAAAYVDPGYGYGYGAVAYVDPGYDYGYGTVSYVERGYGFGHGAAAYPGCNCGYGTAAYVDPGYGSYGYGPGAYVAPRYGYTYRTRPYIAPRYGYGYGVVPHRRYYSGPRSAYAAALPRRPRVAVPYRTGRAAIHR